MSIAGHDFLDAIHGPTCHCGQRRSDVLLARRWNVGQPGWAHDGIMIQREYDEIVTERDRIWACVASVASGAGIGGMAVGGEAP